MNASGWLDMEREHARKLLRQRLRDCETANLEALVLDLDMPRPVVAAALRGLMTDGEIGVLRPVGGAGDAGGTDVGGRGSAPTFYRLKRDTDGDARWEQELMKRPAGCERADRILADHASLAGEHPAATARWSFAACEAMAFS